jgi:ATP-binding cassette subfamily B multidrug efflux pump
LTDSVAADGVDADAEGIRPRTVQRAPEVKIFGGVNVMMRILRMAATYRWRIAVGIGCTIVAANFQLMIPQFLGQSVDHAQALLSNSGATPEQAKAALSRAALFLLMAGFLRGIFTMVHNYLGESIGQRIGYQLRLAYFEKLQRMSFSYHDSVHSGDLMTRGMLDIEGVRRFVDGSMLRVIVLVILVSYGGYYLIGTDAVLGMLALSFVPIVAWRGAISRIYLRRTWRALQECLSLLTRIMEENLGGIRVVRSFVARDHEMAKFDSTSLDAIDMSMQRVQIRYRNAAIMTYAFYAAMGMVLLVGGGKIIDGEMTVGGLIEFLTFMAILQQPVRQIGMIVNATARASISGARVFAVLDLDPAVQDKPGAADLKVTEGALRFEDVSFDYDTPDGKTHALKNISFEIRPGKTLGIVGPPGSGKSTIAHLIPRFYDVTTGRIMIDGQDIRDVTLDSLRDAVGVVQQDTFMFTAEIESNVAYGEPEAGMERVTGASESAQLHDYVMRLPDSYNTLVGERGLSLSGGQRQRLSIARSIMLKPTVIVFDDSTAAIDAATEQRIRAALMDRTRNQATLIISHRLSSLMHADEILFIEAGEIIERGSHTELLAQGGRYRDLFELQVQSGQDPEKASLPPEARSA